MVKQKRIPFCQSIHLTNNNVILVTLVRFWVAVVGNEIQGDTVLSWRFNGVRHVKLEVDAILESELRKLVQQIWSKASVGIAFENLLFKKEK